MYIGHVYIVYICMLQKKGHRNRIYVVSDADGRIYTFLLHGSIPI